MKTRSIAVLGLNKDAEKAFQSMLAIVAPRAHAHWTIAPPESADVLMASPLADPVIVENWTRSEKPLIEVRGMGPLRSMSAFFLQHPFRVMQLLTLLDDVARALDSTSAQASAGTLTPVADAAAVGGEWAFAQSLREWMRRPVHDELFHAVAAIGTVHVRSDACAYRASDEVIGALREGSLRLGALEPVVPGNDASSDAASEWRPALELIWWTGWWSAPRLAPWVEADRMYRLRRWPDFGRVPGAQGALSLCALLARSPCTRDRLAATSGRSMSDINRFFNASTLTGLLVPHMEPVQPVLSPAPARSGRWDSLLRGLRERLGLAA